MEENVVLQVVLHKGEGIEIRLGNGDVNPLMLVGILEQVKMNILSTSETQDMSEGSVTKSAKYDA